MFKKRSFLIVLSLIAIYYIAGSFMFKVTERSKKRYFKTLCSMQPTATKHYGASKRNYVTKDLWINNQEELYHYLIVSEDSILHLNQTKSSQTKVIEEMENITCYLQQKKYYTFDENSEELDKRVPMQQVCVLKIKNGTYNYFTKHFLGDEALISIYQLPGHELSNKLSLYQAPKILDGYCDSVSFDFHEQKPNLKTKNLKAKIFMANQAL